MKTLGGTCILAWGVALALHVGSATAALAQTEAPTATGLGGDYDPLGLPLGGFRLFPSLTVATTFDDNIRRTEEDRLSDTIFRFTPIIALRSLWAQHALNFTATSSTFLYSKYSSENITTYDFNADGRLDVTGAIGVTGQAGLTQLYLLRSSVELPLDAAKPLSLTVARANAAVEYQSAQLGVQFGVAFEQIRYGSLAMLDGTEVDWADQNHNVISPRARIFYQFQEAYAAYVEAIYEKREFEMAVDRFGFDRSSSGSRIRGGVTAALTNLIQGEAFIGYLEQQYPAPLEDISGIDFGASITWSVTPLTTVQLFASRTVNDTTFAGVSGIDDRTINLAVSHELLRNLVLRANVGYANSLFQGSDRTDDTVSVGGGFEYFLNRFFSLALRYDFQNRDSDSGQQTYTSNLFSIAVRGHL
jgi:hypothetical protein